MTKSPSLKKKGGKRSSNWENISHLQKIKKQGTYNGYKRKYDVRN